MDDLIRIFLENSTLTLLIVGLIAAGASLALRPRPLHAAVVVEDLFSYFLLFSVGVSFAYNFIVHVFFGDMAARFIGWQPSPFQAEVGMASLGYSAVGFLAFRGGFAVRAAAVVGPAIFLLGAAAGHVYQMIVAHNFAPGNAGVVFYTDIGLPIIAFALLALQHKFGDGSAPAHYGAAESAGMGRAVLRTSKE